MNTRVSIGLHTICMIFGLVLWGCVEKPTAPPTPVPPAQAAEEGTNMGFALTSQSFANNTAIPDRYVARGSNISPQLSWSNLPPGTQELALLVVDPDAPSGDFVHWIVYGIPTTLPGLEEGVRAQSQPDETVPFLQGRNDAGKRGYFGPMPPPGKVHHYHFRLFALDQSLGLPAEANKGELRKALAGHVLAETELVGTYLQR